MRRHSNTGAAGFSPLRDRSAETFIPGAACRLKSTAAAERGANSSPRRAMNRMTAWKPSARKQQSGYRQVWHNSCFKCQTAHRLIFLQTGKMTGSATVSLRDRRIALFDPAQCLAGHSGEGGDLSFSGDLHGRAGTLFQGGVPMAFRQARQRLHARADAAASRRGGACRCSPLRFDLASISTPGPSQEHGVEHPRMIVSRPVRAKSGIRAK